MPADEIAQIYKNLFNSEAGKIVLEDLRNRCFVKISTVETYNSVYPNEVIFKEGMRSVFLHIENQIKIEPEPIKESEEDF